MKVTTQDDQKLFVSQFPPFNHLSEEALHRGLKKLKIGHEKAGVCLSMERYSGIVLIRSGSLELRNESNSLIDKMSATNCFLFTERAVNQVASAHCLEDCLLYFFRSRYSMILVMILVMSARRSTTFFTRPNMPVLVGCLIAESATTV